MIYIFNSLVNRFFDMLVCSFGTPGPWPAMITTSLFASIVLVLIFRFASRRKVMRRKKNRAIAGLLEFALFKDNLPATFSAFKDSAKATGAYFAEQIVPLTASLPVMVVILIQANASLSCRPLRPGETAVLNATVRKNIPLMQAKIRAEPSSGLEIEAGPVRAVLLNEVSWRLRAVSQGEHYVDIHIGAGTPVQKSVTVSLLHRRVSFRRPGPGIVERFLNPSEPGLPADNGIESITLTCKPALYPAAGTNLGWLTAFIGLTLVAALILKSADVG